MGEPQERASSHGAAAASENIAATIQLPDGIAPADSCVFQVRDTLGFIWEEAESC